MTAMPSFASIVSSISLDTYWLQFSTLLYFALVFFLAILVTFLAACILRLFFVSSILLYHFFWVCLLFFCFSDTLFDIQIVAFPFEGYLVVSLGLYIFSFLSCLCSFLFATALLPAGHATTEQVSR